MKKKNSDRKNKLREKVRNSINRDDYNKYLKIPNGVSVWRPSVGFNVIDILPYIVGGDNHPAGYPKGDEDFCLEFHIHKLLTGEKILCMNKTYHKECPICNEIEANRNDIDEDVYNQIKAKRRCLYNIVDVESGEDKIMLFEESYYLFEEELHDVLQSSGEEFENFPDPEEGSSIKFRAVKAKFGKAEFLKYKNISFEERESYEESVVKETISLDELLIIPTQEEVSKLFFSSTLKRNNPEEEEEEEEEEIDYKKRNKVKSKTSSERGRTSRRKDKEEEIEEEEPPFEVEEDEEGNEECPHGFEFGSDCDENEECKECDVWEDCEKANSRDNMEVEKSREKESQSIKKLKGRGRRK